VPVVPASDLRAFFQEVGVTQEEFGAALGYTGPTVRRWLAPGGYAPPVIRVVIAMTRQLTSLKQQAELPFQPKAKRKR
jgi:DNA-binding transcriptional regulator YiaG